MGKIGIYGGSFDPVHNGHIHAARFACSALALDKLLLIPANHSPGKNRTNTTQGQHRLNMLKLAFADLPNTEVDAIELTRGGESYTRDTLLALKARYPHDELIFLMGTDMFLGFLNWYYPAQILELATLAVFFRGQSGEMDAIAEQRAKLLAMGGKVVSVENPIVEISSTDIRRLLTFGCAAPFLPEAVLTYIHTNGLYETGQNYKDLSEEKLTQVVRSLLKPSRVAHVMGCRDTAVKLARLWGADAEKAARAALLHDITKALDGPLQLTLCSQYDIMANEFAAHDPKTVHAFTGSLVARRVFGECEQVVDAIRYHTTAKADMTTLEKIIYVADYMEPTRDFPGVERLRELAFRNLDEAVILGLEMTLALLEKRGSTVSSESAAALAYLKSRKRD